MTLREELLKTIDLYRKKSMDYEDFVDYSGLSAKKSGYYEGVSDTYKAIANKLEKMLERVEGGVYEN